jgi:hypothetical protein
MAVRRTWLEECSLGRVSDLTSESSGRGDQECAERQCEASEGWVSCRGCVYTECASCYACRSSH